MARKNRRLRISSITVKIIAVNCLSLFACAIVLMLSNYSFFRSDSVKYYASRALSVAETVAASIDGDSLSEAIRSGIKGQSWHQDKEFVDGVFSRIELAYLYILAAEYGENVVYYLEATAEDSDLSLCEADNAANYAADMFGTMETGISSTTDMYDSGDYGKLVSGFAAVRDSNGNVVGVVGADVSMDDVFNAARKIEFVMRLLVVISLCSFVPILFQAMLLKRMVGRPIKELTVASARLGSGDLDVSLSIHTGDEIEELADTFTKMAAQLGDYIENLTQITAEKERIGAELNVATQIQASMLPCIFPAFPDRSEFDVYGYMLPAKEVGGDFYDFFLIDENHLAVVIADVSGKGVPAALFMVIAKTLIKNNAQYGKSPKEVFETVNDMLCETNEAGMFVTAFMGILDIQTGAFSYVNAGHNPPLIKRYGGDYEWLSTKPGFVLAGMEDMSYKQDEITLNGGDMLYMYTDGVTEAVNRENELFTEPKLLEVANRHKAVDMNEFIAHIKAEIDMFANGAEQADDITMLILKISESETGEK